MEEHKKCIKIKERFDEKIEDKRDKNEGEKIENVKI